MRLRRSRQRTDEDLLRRSRIDAGAFAEFYDRHERAVFIYMARRARSSDLAADLTAEVFAAALEGADGFRSRDGAPAVAWLFGIARNVLANSYRQARVVDDARTRLAMPRLELTDETVEHLERTLDAEAGQGAMAFLAQLPVDQRVAIRAHILEDRDYGEIADELQCSTAVIRQRVSRGLSALRKQVQQS